MSAKKTAAKKETAARKTKSTSNGDANVAQIRELIFGEQMTGYEERFTLLEQKLTEEVASMRSDVDQALKELREFMKSRTAEVEAASVNRNQIADSFEKLAKTLRR
ncbi:MAG: hypothetical protein AAGC74_09605 [Verrucomicrobiota bacterium]